MWGSGGGCAGIVQSTMDSENGGECAGLSGR